MKPPNKRGCDTPCDKCVGLCCRYFALAIDKPKTRRDFDDIRWYLLHHDTTVFVEDGDWYLQINARCRALRPDNRCAIYENRPAICRAYKTNNCDWQDSEWPYEHVFAEPEQLARYAREYLSRRRRRRAAAGNRRSAAPVPKERRLRVRRTGSSRRPRITVPLLKSA